MNAALDWHLARALLDWQLELGATEAIGDVPIDRFAESAEGQPRPVAAVSAGASTAPATTDQPIATAVVARADPSDAVAEAERRARAATDLGALSEALAAFPHCELRRGARSCVFADGRPGARVMIIGEGPGREEDLRGLPFVGPAGQMLDRMFAAIGLSRGAPDAEHALYITNTVPWRPPGNREPTPEELAMLRPFLARHVELADPDFLVLAGNVPCQAVLCRRGITGLRGRWVQGFGRPALPMLHPSYLLRKPEAKREAWVDLLTLQARLREKP